MHLSIDLLVLAGALAVTLGRTQPGSDLPDRAIALALLPLATMAAGEVGTLLIPKSLLWCEQSRSFAETESRSFAY